jgi:hypothetical protein
MNERIRKLAVKAGATLEKGYIELSDGQFMLSDNVDLDKSNMDLEKFAELLLQDYTKKTIQGLMRDTAFAKVMDEHYKEKWAHRFD